MKNNSEVLNTKKRKIPRKTTKKGAPRAWYVWSVALIFLGLACMYIHNRYYASYSNFAVIKEIEELKKALEHIHSSCSVMSTSQELAPIDFLNVKEFSGSQVGPLHLKYPDKWQGPYCETSICYKGHPFALLTNHKGYYIVPGNGVVLDNGLIIGKDITFTSDCDIEALVTSFPALVSENKLLVGKLNITGCCDNACHT